MKWRAVLVLLGLCGILTGCSVVGLEPQGLMQPPRATGDKQNVYEALEEAVENQAFTLKYPRTGEYRSAIIMHPVSGAQQEDAVVLYQLRDAESPGTRITFLSKRESGWTNVGTFQSTASQVDRVAFGDLNGDGRDEIIVGWGNGVTKLAELSVYGYASDGSVREATPTDNAARQFYNEFVLYDLDGDGTKEIFTASLGTAEHPANGKLLSISDSHKLEVMSSVALDRDVVQYSHIRAGAVDGSTNGVLLDGTTSSSQVLTELVYWDASQQVLRSPFDSEEATEPSVNPTTRRVPVYSQLRSDPVRLEFPILELFPGYPADAQETDAFLTHWYWYDVHNGKTVQDGVEYINLTHEYAFKLPSGWPGHVTAQVEEDRQSVTFYQWNRADEVNQTGSRGDALLKLQAVPRSQWEACEKDASLSQLMENGDMRLYGSFPNPANPLALTASQVTSQIAPFEQNT